MADYKDALKEMERLSDQYGPDAVAMAVKELVGSGFHLQTFERGPWRELSDQVKEIRRQGEEMGAARERKRILKAIVELLDE